MTGDRAVRRRASALAPVGALAAMGLLLAGCNAKPEQTQPSQLAAVVGDVEITQREVDRVFELTAPPALPQVAAKQQRRAILDQLVRQEALAQQARREGLENTPALLVDLHLAERQLLAQAIERRTAQAVGSPPDTVAQSYVDQNLQAFAQRQLLTLEEISFQGMTDELAQELDAAVAAGAGMDRMEGRLREKGVKSVRRTVSTSTDTLPPPLRDPLLTVGRSMPLVVKANEGQGFIVQLRSATPSPRAGAVALDVARQALTQQATGMALQDTGRAALAAVGVTYHGEFADVPAMPSAASQAPGRGRRGWVVLGASFVAGLLWPTVFSAILRLRSGGRWLPYFWPLKRAPRAPRVGKLRAMVRNRDVVRAPAWYARLFHLLLWGLWLGTLALLVLRLSLVLQAGQSDLLGLLAAPLGLLLGLPLCQGLGHSLWRVERSAHLLPAAGEYAEGEATTASPADPAPQTGSRLLRGLRTLLWCLSAAVPAAAALLLG